MNKKLLFMIAIAGQLQATETIEEKIERFAEEETFDKALTHLFERRNPSSCDEINALSPSDCRYAKNEALSRALAAQRGTNIFDKTFTAFKFLELFERICDCQSRALDERAKKLDEREETLNKNSQ